MALGQTRRQYQTEAMVNWIVDSVNKSITPELVREHVIPFDVMSLFVYDIMTSCVVVV